MNAHHHTHVWATRARRAACIALLGAAAALAGAPAQVASAAVTVVPMPSGVDYGLLAEANGDVRIPVGASRGRLFDGRIPAAGGKPLLSLLAGTTHDERWNTAQLMPEGGAVITTTSRRGRFRTFREFERVHGVAQPPMVITTRGEGKDGPEMYASPSGAATLIYDEWVGARVRTQMRLRPTGGTFGAPFHLPGPDGWWTVGYNAAGDGMYLSNHSWGPRPRIYLQRVLRNGMLGAGIAIETGKPAFQENYDIAEDGTVAVAWATSTTTHGKSPQRTDRIRLVVIPAGSSTPIEIPVPPVSGPADALDGMPWLDLAIAGRRAIIVSDNGGKNGHAMRVVSASLDEPSVAPTVTVIPDLTGWLNEVDVIGRPDGRADALAIVTPDDPDAIGATLLRMSGHADGTWGRPETVYDEFTGNMYLSDLAERPSGGIAVIEQTDDWDLIGFSTNLILTDD